MTAILLSLGACLGWGVADFIAGIKSRRLPPLAVMILANPFGILIVSAIVIEHKVPFPRSPAMLWAVLSGFAGVFALYLLYQGLAVGPMAIVAPISGTGVIIPVLAGLLQGDSLTMMQLLGILTAVVGTFFAAREKKAPESPPRLVRGLNYALTSAIGVGLYFIFMDWASDSNPYWASLVMRTSYGLVLLPIIFLTRTSLKGTRPHLLPIAVMGIIDALAGFSFALASTMGMLSKVSVVSALYPGVTVLLSSIFLRERIQLSQGLGVLLALTGIVLISAS